MVYIEASAVGTPVVGSKVGGIPYAVRENETGLLAEPRDIGSLCAALRRILDDDDFARRLGEAGSRRVAAEFDWRRLGARTSEIFGDVANTREA
jgi:glycosyltransferase involved in cell wall biosynthesis